MIRKIKKAKFVFVAVLCVFLLGCVRKESETTNYSSANNEDISIFDYTEWYCDTDNSGTYNYVKWIELDAWLADAPLDYNYSEMTFDVFYEDTIIASDYSVIVEANYIKCCYNTSCEGAVVTESGYLSPGSYTIIIKDISGNGVISSSCNVTLESGNLLSTMVASINQIENQDNQLTLQICFNGDILPYSKTGYYLTISYDNGETSYIPERYSIYPANTYIMAKIDDYDASKNDVLVSVYCGDGSFVCETKVSGK